MSWEPNSSVSAEEARLMKAVSGSIKKQPAPASPRSPAAQVVLEGWKIYLKDLPAEDGKQVTVTVGTKQAYQSEAGQTTVTHIFNFPFQGFGQQNDIKVSIPAMDGFEAAQSFKAAEGGHIRFMFTPEGLNVSQQTKPFI